MSLEPSSYTSKELFHFVGRKNPSNHEANYQTLLNILRQRSVSYPPHRDGWGEMRITIDSSRSLLGEELVVPTVTCFCDIPFDHLKLHVKKYGPFGLSFPRELLIYYGARPVMYFPISLSDGFSLYGKNLARSIEVIYKSFEELVVDKIEKKSFAPRGYGQPPISADAAICKMWEMFARDFLAFLKPFNSSLTDEDPENFYLEREWRKYQNLVFTPNQVQTILVADGYVEALEDAFPEYRGKVKVPPT